MSRQGACTAVDVGAMQARNASATERVSFSGTGDFLKTVRERVQKNLSGSPARGDRRLQLKAVLILIWFFASFILLLNAGLMWLQILLCLSYGIAASAVGFNIFHDANHGAMSSSTRVNQAVGMLASVLLGPSRYLWSYKHHVLHHRFTNIHRWDDDLETRGFLRISPHQSWKPRYRGQHLFVVALYAVNAIEMVWVKDFVQYFTLRINPHQEIPAMSRAEKAEFWIGKILYLSIFIMLPLALVPLSHAIVGFLVYQFTLGLSLALVFGMAHQVESVAFSALYDGSLVIHDDWAAHQMRTTANFANVNPVWCWFSGGLNHQIEHHLFPSMSHTHYPDIAATVSGTAREFGLPYIHFATYGSALHSHYRLLRKLSAEPGGLEFLS
jgi:linoleoyl-CoA desaturase